MKCKYCRKVHTPFNSLDNVCKDVECQTKKGLALLEKSKKEKPKNKRITHPHLYERENKSDLQKAVNAIAREIDRGIRCVDCERRESNPCWDGGHRKSVGSTPSLRFNLHNIFKQTRYCNTKSEGAKADYDKGLIKMYGQDYFNYVDGLALKYKVLKLPNDRLPEAKKEARKILRELRKDERAFFLEKDRIRLRTEFNKRIGIYEE